MELNNSFSALIYMPTDLTQPKRDKCFKLLINKNFTGYDFKTGNNISIIELLNKYPNRQQYSTTYKGKSFGISCAEGNNFIIFRTDNSLESSLIILQLVNEFCTIIEDISFCYIDYEGDPPKKFDSLINDISITWLFKYNYFGKKYLEKFGKEFFENLPCEHQEYITDNIIRIDLCKDIFSPIDKDLRIKIKQYCSDNSIDVNFYNYKNYLID